MKNDGKNLISKRN